MYKVYKIGFMPVTSKEYREYLILEQMETHETITNWRPKFEQ